MVRRFLIFVDLKLFFLFRAIGRCRIEFQRHKIFICIYIHFLEFSAMANTFKPTHTNIHFFSLSAWAAVIINLCHYTHIHMFALLHLIKQCQWLLESTGEEWEQDREKNLLAFPVLSLLPFRLSDEPNLGRILMQSSKMNVAEQKKSPEVELNPLRINGKRSDVIKSQTKSNDRMNEK